VLFLDEYINVFKSDMEEHLENINDCLLEMEKGENVSVLVNKLFRSFHTMKSMTASMGFHRTSGLIHKTEDLLYEIREGRLNIDHEMIEFIFLFHDFLENALEVFVNTGDEDGLNAEYLMNMLSIIIGKNENENSGKKKEHSLPPIYIQQEKLDFISETAKKGFNFFLVLFKLEENCPLKDIRIWMNFKALSDFSTVVITIPQVEEEELKQNKKDQFEEAFQVALILSEYDKEDVCGKIEKTTNNVEGLVVEELCENNSICKFNLGDLEQAIKDQIISMEKRLPDTSKKDQNRKSEERKVEKTLESNPQKEGKKDSSGKTKEQGEWSHRIIEEKRVPFKSPFHGDIQISKQNEGALMKVSSEKIDQFVDFLGELMILQEQHKQELLALIEDKSSIMNNLFRLEKITKKLHDVSMSLRMQPLKNILQRLRRVARDTSVELDKPVEVEIIGENTEIDRDIGERIFEPLMHLVRNGIAHGIENIHERTSVGKNPSGKITMNAFNKMGFLYIQIKDDGRGLNTDRILEKAIEKGLAHHGDAYAHDEITKFIFLPGFSTQNEVDNISGRGVGLNVVEEEVEKLRGRIDMDSFFGKGTTFTIKIPINNTAMTGTVIHLLNEKYILPTINVKEIICPTDAQWVRVGGERTMVKVRNEIISLINLDQLFGVRLKNSDSHRNLVIILEMDKKYLGFPVDHVVGNQEIVVKSLGEDFKEIQYSKGFTILGDGKISLILDMDHLFQQYSFKGDERDAYIGGR
jgi:two-component system, chemotaxis family, sensor kinase CheA